jgi:hypothetical protein
MPGMPISSPPPTPAPPPRSPRSCPPADGLGARRLICSISYPPEPEASCSREEDAVALRTQLREAAVGVRPRVGPEAEPDLGPRERPRRRAMAKRPRKAAGAVGGTAEPLPRTSCLQVASHRTLKLTVAGTTFGPRNWKLSRRQTSLASRVDRAARLPLGRACSAQVDFSRIDCSAPFARCGLSGTRCCPPSMATSVQVWADRCSWRSSTAASARSSAPSRPKRLHRDVRRRATAHQASRPEVGVEWEGRRGQPSTPQRPVADRPGRPAGQRHSPAR